MNSSPSQRSGPMIVLVCTVVVVSTFAVFGYAVPRFFKLTRPAFAPTPAPVPSVFTTTALYAPADEKRLTAIGTALQGKKPIGDADLDWAIDLLQRGPVIDNPHNRGSFTIMTLSQLGNHHTMTPAQSRKLAVAVLPYADDPPPTERAPLKDEDGRKLQAPAVSIQSVALMTLGALNDDLARAKLQSLAHTSATPKIRRDAEKLLARQRERDAKTPAKNNADARN